MLKNLFAKYAEIKDRRDDGEGGFTLIELLVVVVIIGILVAIAIPLYLNYTQGAKSDSVQADVRNAVTAIQQCYSDNDQALPSAATFSTSGTALTGTGTNCDDDKVVVSEGTESIDYVPSGSNYTLTASDKGHTHTWVYDSTKGNIVQGDYSAGADGTTSG